MAAPFPRAACAVQCLYDELRPGRPRSIEDLHFEYSGTARSVSLRWSPLYGFQVGTCYVTENPRGIVIYVMRHVSGVPNHNVGILHRFAIDEVVQMSLKGASHATGLIDAVIQLRPAVLEDPEIALRKRPIG
jgi:hypothetical protein